MSPTTHGPRGGEVVLPDGTIVSDQRDLLDILTDHMKDWHQTNSSDPNIDWNTVINDPYYLSRESNASLPHSPLSLNISLTLSTSHSPCIKIITLFTQLCPILLTGISLSKTFVLKLLSVQIIKALDLLALL